MNRLDQFKALYKRKKEQERVFNEKMANLEQYAADLGIPLDVLSDNEVIQRVKGQSPVQGNPSGEYPLT